MTMIALAAFVCGLLFALGLGIAGMTRPEKVLAFLDVGGNWDASLALVMVAAIAVHATLRRRILRRRAPLLAPSFASPAQHALDARLFVGAAIFGIGWGLAGLCPGPALTVLASGKMVAAVFVLAMLIGMRAADASAGLAGAIVRSAAQSIGWRPRGESPRAAPRFAPERGQRSATDCLADDA